MMYRGVFRTGQGSGMFNASLGDTDVVKHSRELQMGMLGAGRKMRSCRVRVRFVVGISAVGPGGDSAFACPDHWGLSRWN